MNPIGTILLLTLSVQPVWYVAPQKEATHAVTLKETSCAPTRRMRCSYYFVEVSSEKAEKEERHFNILFYIGADLSEGKKDDAIFRLDRFFKITREASPNPETDNTGTIGYGKSVTLRIQGSKYEFSREDGEEIVVDVDKRTRP